MSKLLWSPCALKFWESWPRLGLKYSPELCFPCNNLFPRTVAIIVLVFALEHRKEACNLWDEWEKLLGLGSCRSVGPKRVIKRESKLNKRLCKTLKMQAQFAWLGGSVLTWKTGLQMILVRSCFLGTLRDRPLPDFSPPFWMNHRHFFFWCWRE